MAAKRFVVIFVSRRNSLRSILAQACLAHLGADRFSASSCGHPAHVSDEIHPAAISALTSAGMQVPQSQPHGWNDMITGSFPRASFVITLDEATLAFQPNWPGQPDAALWDFPDVAALDNAEAAVLALDPPLEQSIILYPERVRAMYAAIKGVSDLLKTEFLTTLNLEVPGPSLGDND